MILVKNKGKYAVCVGSVLCYPGESVFNLKYEDIIGTVNLDIVEIINLAGKHIIMPKPQQPDKPNITPIKQEVIAEPKPVISSEPNPAPEPKVEVKEEPNHELKHEPVAEQSADVAETSAPKATVSTQDSQKQTIKKNKAKKI